MALTAWGIWCTKATSRAQAAKTEIKQNITTNTAPAAVTQPQGISEAEEDAAVVKNSGGGC